MRVLFLIAVCILGLAPGIVRAEDGREVTAALRGGYYADTDKTQVVRSLATVSGRLGQLTLGANAAVDVITSASTDVRTSPFLDAMTSASGRVEMKDRRIETTAQTGWNDGRGHLLSGSITYANENDYRSYAGGVSGALDFAERNTTLLVGLTSSRDTITSVVDRAFQRTLSTAGYSLGVAQVLTPTDALRLKYDGGYLDGYMASPYRGVRFGDWSIGRGGATDATVFRGTIGAAGGLPEALPQTRLRHAATAEWVHEIVPKVGMLLSYRFAIDDWGVTAHTALGELRVASFEDFQLRATYRLYRQSEADFYRSKYLDASTAYSHFTADKELGTVQGHGGSVDLGWQFARRAHDGYDGALDLIAHVAYYAYPEFPLLASRTSVFSEVGLRWDF